MLLTVQGKVDLHDHDRSANQSLLGAVNVPAATPFVTARGCSTVPDASPGHLEKQF